MIGRPDKDAGTGYEAVMQSNFDRLKRIDFRIKAQTERNLLRAFRELNRLRGILGLSEMMVEKSAYLYRKAQERGLVRGRTVKAVLAASIYVVFREMGVSRVLDDVSRETGVKKKDLAKVYRIIVKELDLKVPMIDPIKCVAKIANKLDVSERTKREAISLMNSIISGGLAAGKDGSGSRSFIHNMHRKRRKSHARRSGSRSWGICYDTKKRSSTNSRELDTHLNDEIIGIAFFQEPFAAMMFG